MQKSQHIHTHTSKVQVNVRKASQTKIWRRKRGPWNCHSSCDNWVCFNTLSSGWRIFPRAAGSSDGAQRLREQARECKRVRLEVILHSRLNELARLFRQLKQNDPLPIHSPPSVLSAPLLMASHHPWTLKYSLKRFYIKHSCTIIWDSHVLYEAVRWVVAPGCPSQLHRDQAYLCLLPFRVNLYLIFIYNLLD